MTAIVSRWARRYVLASALFLLLWQVGAALGTPRRTEVLLAVFGVVLHAVFGKAYSLVPSYFERELAFPVAPVVQFPLVVVGVGGLVAGSLRVGPDWLDAVGAVCWSVGVGVFLGTLGWTIRSNLSGRETATGGASAERRPVDRLANAFVPVALGYLAVGTYETLAIYTAAPLLFDGWFARVAHLLAAGAGGTLVFALGFRLLPRFLVVESPRRFVAVVLPAGALGPAVLATHLGDEPWFAVGAVAEAVAVVAFAVGYALMFARSERRRVGFYGVLAGVSSGVAGVALGLWSVWAAPSTPTVLAHLRANLLGFLGLTIVGVAYQFYPPGIGTLPGASNRTARLSIGGLAVGVLAQVVGLVGDWPPAVTFGQMSAIAGTLLYVFLLVATFLAHRQRHAP